ncbi:MAG TPA: hypothetical protein VHW01_10455 [Polyangiaceae bacterium]|nr:hypothetical protein [Polyangiaceae bacterium]
MFYFKYANLVVHEENRLAVLFGKGPVSWENVVLPMGISFVAFEM